MSLYSLFDSEYTKLVCSQDWETTLKMAQICDVQIPEDMISILENIKCNNEALEEYGVHFAVNTAQKIFASGTSYGIHLFTTNR